MNWERLKLNLRLSLAQMEISIGDPEANLEKARDMAALAAEQRADIVVFPELWATGYDLENAAEYSTPIDKGIFAEMASLAKESKICVVGSSLSLMETGRFGNTSVFFDSRGKKIGEYTKIHLFQLMDEHRYLAAGDHPTVLETEWGKAGLAICYDLRFPELFRIYATEKVKMIFLSAEWPHPRLAHWQILLRARAIENQVYVIACNRAGTSKGTHFCGHSCVIDPWGEVVAEAGENEEVLTVAIDIDRVDQVRGMIPVLEDRRL